MTNAEAIETLRANYPDACFEQLRCAVDMAINALTKEAWKEEHPVSPLLQKLATNLQPSKQDADDTISRKAAIDAMENVDWYHISKDGQLVHGSNSVDYEPLYKAKDVYAVLNKIPSAQPKKRTEERTETHACDCISRQAAIDEIEERKNANGYRNVAVISELNRLEGYIMRLPSAQPVDKDIDVPSTDTISRQAAIESFEDTTYTKNEIRRRITELPSAQPEITYQNCSDALLKMWMDNVLTDGEYNRIMDKLNKFDTERKTDE